MIIELINIKVRNNNNLKYDLFDYEYDKNKFLFNNKPYKRINKKELKYYSTFEKYFINNIIYFLFIYLESIYIQRNEDMNQHIINNCSFDKENKKYELYINNLKYNINKIREIIV